MLMTNGRPFPLGRDRRLGEPRLDALQALGVRPPGKEQVAERARPGERGRHERPADGVHDCVGQRAQRPAVVVTAGPGAREPDAAVHASEARRVGLAGPRLHLAAIGDRDLLAKTILEAHGSSLSQAGSDIRAARAGPRRGSGPCQEPRRARAAAASRRRRRRAGGRGPGRPSPSRRRQRTKPRRPASGKPLLFELALRAVSSRSSLFLVAVPSENLRKRCTSISSCFDISTGGL